MNFVAMSFFLSTVNKRAKTENTETPKKFTTRKTLTSLLIGGILKHIYTHTFSLSLSLSHTHTQHGGGGARQAWVKWLVTRMLRATPYATLGERRVRARRRRGFECSPRSGPNGGRCSIYVLCYYKSTSADAAPPPGAAGEDAAGGEGDGGAAQEVASAPNLGGGGSWGGELFDS